MADIEHYKRYGWKVNETNLNTLPEDAPEAAKDLAKWLTLEGRRSSLEEWLGCVSEDSRIHGKFWHIGAWTHRMSHSNPNQANIPSAFNHAYEKEGFEGWFVRQKDVEHGPMSREEATSFVGGDLTAVEEVKAKYDGRARALFHVPKDAWLVGCDAEGIQLRILAHYMKSSEYVKAITEGRKEDETDIHNLNKKALGSVCKNRDTAKTFIYAWLLGAGTAKIAEILGCTIPQASQAEKNFLDALPELKRIKQLLIPRDAGRGYFTGLDGRKVKCDSEHFMLSGYLQNGEAVVIKRWALKWTRRASEAGIKFKLVDVVHDETQTEVYSKEDGERLLEIQSECMVEVGEELGLFCPLATSGSIGKSWLQTH